MSAQDATIHSPLAQACDRFLAVALIWDVARVPMQLQSETLDYEETIDMERLLAGGDSEEEEVSDANGSWLLPFLSPH